MIVWPAFETWAELLVEVPVEVETKIGALLDLLTLKNCNLLQVDYSNKVDRLFLQLNQNITTLLNEQFHVENM